jgi:hypothetical protein
MTIDGGGDIYLTYQTTGTISGATKTGVDDIVVMMLSPASPSIIFTEYSGQPVAEPPTVGTLVTFTYGVRNNGGLPINNITINDNLGTILLHLPDMNPGQEETATSTVYQLTPANFTQGIVRAQATVDGSYYDTITSDYAETNVSVTQEPLLSITKVTTSYDNYVSGFIIYSITVRNTGNIPFTTLELADDLAGFISRRPSLDVGGTWIEDDIKVQITQELFDQYYDIKNVATVTGYSIDSMKQSFSATNYTTLCIVKDTMILMYDATLKPVQDIKRGDVVSTGHQVARLCEIKLDPYLDVDLMSFDVGSLGQGVPSKRLEITPNHPIVFVNARRPAKCFSSVKGVAKFGQKGIRCLYDLQFDHDGTYIANGVEIQSCSPRSATKPLPKELYYDPTLYSDEVVWDSYEHTLKLITRQVNLRVPRKKLSLTSAMLRNASVKKV